MSPLSRLAGGLVDIGSLMANGLSGSTVSLVGLYEFNRAVMVPVVVPIHIGRCLFAGLLSGI